MRDVTLFTKFDELTRQQNAIAYHMQLGFSGEALFDETIKALLIKKGLFTEEEFKETLGEKIREINAKDAERAKAEAEKIIVPTPAEVAQVEGTKVETPAETPVVETKAE